MCTNDWPGILHNIYIFLFVEYYSKITNKVHPSSHNFTQFQIIQSVDGLWPASPLSLRSVIQTGAWMRLAVLSLSVAVHCGPMQNL